MKQVLQNPFVGQAGADASERSAPQRFLIVGLGESGYAMANYFVWTAVVASSVAIKSC
jgi:hypothetical protein